MTWIHERTEIHRTTVNHIVLNMFQGNSVGLDGSYAVKHEGVTICVTHQLF